MHVDQCIEEIKHFLTLLIIWQTYLGSAGGIFVRVDVSNPENVLGGDSAEGHKGSWRMAIGNTEYPS